MRERAGAVYINPTPPHAYTIHRPTQPTHPVGACAAPRRPPSLPRIRTPPAPLLPSFPLSAGPADEASAAATTLGHYSTTMMMAPPPSVAWRPWKTTVRKRVGCCPPRPSCWPAAVAAASGSPTPRRRSPPPPEEQRAQARVQSVPLRRVPWLLLLRTPSLLLAFAFGVAQLPLSTTMRRLASIDRSRSPQPRRVRCLEGGFTCVKGVHWMDTIEMGSNVNRGSAEWHPI